jgi:hypothetical protein
MPALWKSILHKEKPDYSSNANSQFEMMSSKNSRTATQHRDTVTYEIENESDERNLIPGGPYVTTNIHGGDESPRREGGFGDSQIVRTVEVHQYRE